jgi:hypothetical protein
MNLVYFVYNDFTVNTAVVNNILTSWVGRGVDKCGFDLRYSTCDWMAENLEHVAKSYIPPSHPRTLVESNKIARSANHLWCNCYYDRFGHGRYYHLQEKEETTWQSLSD